jgi:uncharacterized protein YcaQ
MTGRILVDSRVHFHKRFDLAERVAPALAAVEPLDADAFRKWHLTRGLHAMGAATEADLRSYLTFPRQPRGTRQKALAELLKRGEVVEIAVEGDRARWFALAEDLGALAAAGRRSAPSRGTTLLAPFDSFLWYRERSKRLFGFDYRIEVYTPGHQRVHGYYVLPIFHHGQLIGRLDAKNHRRERRLEVRRVGFEPWFANGSAPPAASWGALDRDEAIAGLAEAVWSLATFLSAERVTVGRVRPPAFAALLKRALRDGPVGARADAATAVP